MSFSSSPFSFNPPIGNKVLKDNEFVTEWEKWLNQVVNLITEQHALLKDLESRVSTLEM